MTYYNIVFKYGEELFLRRTRDIGFCGTIIPDLPPEEGQTYLATSSNLGLSPVLFFTPTSADERMRTVAAQSSGFIYCVARRGVTGRQTAFDDSLDTIWPAAVRQPVCPWRWASASAAARTSPCSRAKQTWRSSAPPPSNWSTPRDPKR